MNTDLMRGRGVLILKDLAPFRLGNLVRSIISYPSPGGWSYEQLKVGAPYGMILDTGSKFFKGHKGWWSIKGVDALQTYYDDTLNGQATNLTKMYQSVAEKARTTPAKQKGFLRNVSR
jgi:hypothetical protein